MPIDSICSGCGKTLRVNDEFVGRKARCPACGNVYVVGEASPDPAVAIPSPSVAVAETTYAPPGTTSDTSSLPLADSWSALQTSPSQLESPSERQSVEQSGAVSEQRSSGVPPGLDLPLAMPIAEQKFFVRTPNTMIYGPSDKATVLDWIEQGRLDDTCHIREESSEQWLGLAAWRFQTRKVNAPVSNPVRPTTNGFGDVPRANVQSAGYATKAGNGTVVLVLGLVSWVLCPTVVGGWICAILAIVFASFEFNKLRSGQTPGNERWLVLLGMWLGIANLVAWVLCVVGLIITAIVSN
jgi:DNA-directed RNA polymerase subunit RPC12/RpoP